MKGKTRTGPTAPKGTDGELIELIETLGPAKAAERLGCSQRALYARRRRLEDRLGRQVKAPESSPNKTRWATVQHPARVQEYVRDGVVLIGSDAHYWPGYITTAHRAFVKFAKEMQPQIIIKNGDALDGATISRHLPIGWESRPSLIQEIETVGERLDEIQKAAPNAKRYWPLGNHDARFETRLATVAPEYAKIHGVHLKDHFPYWHGCWSVFINDDVVVKHRFKAGIHAPHNNTMWAGKTMVTGHLHSLKVMPISDYNGTRWGVDAGTMADAYGPQFRDYTEDNPVNWRSGFIVATFVEGRLLWPEVVHVVAEGVVEFRGKLIEV